MLIFSIHLILLAASSYYISKRFCANFLERILAAYVLLWTNIVVTALVLSSFSKLGDSRLYFRTSILFALLSVFALRKKSIEQENERFASTESSHMNTGRFFNERLLYITFALVLSVNGLICYHYSPNNWDSLTYHLPRIHFYLSQGNLAHFDTVNLRQTFFPFNGTLFQLFLVIYGQSDKLLNLFNLISWVLAFVAVYRLSRRCKIGHFPSLLAAWIGVMSGQVLAQGTSTTNDILTAVPVVIAVLFGIKWWEGRRSSSAIVTGVALGLAFGTKLTTFFFIPIVFLLICFKWLQSLWKKQPIPFGKREIGHIVLAAVIMAVLVVPFMGINYYYSKQLSAEQYNFLLNRPFSIMSALQTMYTYTMQIIVDPFQYLPLKPGRVVHWAEPPLKKYLFSGWNRNYAISDLYVFGPDLSEDGIYFGFSGILVLFSFVYSLFKPNLRKSPAFWLALTAAGWFLTYCASAKWSLYNQRYFISPYLLMLPLIGLLYETTVMERSVKRSWILGLFIFVIITSVLFSYTYLNYNNQRSWKGIKKNDVNNGRIPIPDVMRGVVSSQKDIKFVCSGYTHGNERLFQFMTYGKNQSFSIGQKKSNNKYNIFSFWSPIFKSLYRNIPSSSAFTVVSIPGKKTAGVTDLGFFGEGIDSYYYYGVSSQKLPGSGDNEGILVRTIFDRFAKEGKSLEDRLQTMELEVVGLNPEDGIVLRIYYTDMKGHNKLLRETTGDFDALFSISEKYKGLFIEAHDVMSNVPRGSSEILVAEYGQKRQNLAVPKDSAALIDADLIFENHLSYIQVEGMGQLEGPYPQWKLPEVKWAKSPIVKIEFAGSMEREPSLVTLDMSFRPQVRNHAMMTIVLNGKELKKYELKDANEWVDVTVRLQPRKGKNLLELNFDPMKNEGRPPESLYMLFKKLSLKSSNS